MHTISSLPLFLLALFTTSALSAPATAQATTSLVQSIDTMNDTLASSITCFGQPTGRTYITPPYFQKCALALRQLPATETIGKFHQGGAFDQYRLPVTKVSGPCQVMIETANGGSMTDRASWLAVRLAAVELTMACTPVVDSAPGYGGTTLTGQIDAIKITVMSTKKVGNATDGTATS